MVKNTSKIVSLANRNLDLADILKEGGMASLNITKIEGAPNMMDSTKWIWTITYITNY